MNLLPIAVLAALGVLATALARRAPGAATGSAHARARRGGVVASVVFATATFAACSTDGGRGSTQVATEPALDRAPLDWGDGYDHVIVYADPPSDAAAPSPTSTDPQTGPARVPSSSDAGLGAGLQREGPRPTGGVPQPASDRTLSLVGLDGSVRDVIVPQESLVAVSAADAEETAAVESWKADTGFALIVADVAGVVGPVGARYVMTADRLIELPAVAGRPPTSASSPGSSPASGPATSSVPSSTADASVTWEPPAAGAWTPEAEASLLDAIRDVDGVESADVVAPGVVAVATSGDRDLLAGVDGVNLVGDDVLLDYAVDERQGEQWALENTGSGAQAGGWPGVEGADTRAPRAWSISEGSGVVVAVIDSGVDLGHEDLTARLWTNVDEVCANGVDDDTNGKVDDCVGWDFGVGDANPRPDALAPSADHGTHVAGVIAAGRNGIGVVGVAPAATVMPLKVANATGAISTSAVYAAIVYAVDQGADIVNLSLATRPGTSRSSVTALETGIAYARDAGVLVVTGAGNDGVDITTRTRAVWPAGFSLLFDNVITVGATTNSDSRATFSNFGDPITLYAPGWWMLSTVPGGYGSKSGTSMAAPMVAGAAADVIASGLATTPADVRSQLVSTAEVLDTGYRLDVAAAVGVPPEADVDVSYEGIDQLLPDTVADLSVHISARSLPAAAAYVRLSLAAAVDYDVYAVEGLAASLAEAGGATATVRSDEAGSFPPIAITDPDALTAGGWTLSASLALPEGDYAFVTELLDESGNALGGSQVAYVTVGEGLPVTSTTLVATTVPPSTTAGGPTTTTAVGSSTTAPPSTDPDASTTTSADGSTTTDPDASTTTDPDASTTTADGGSTSTSPVTTTLGSTTVAPSTTAGGSTTSAPTTTGATTTAPATSSTSTTSTTVSGSTTTVSGSTTTVAGSPTTTPEPGGGTDGAYRIDAMSPRYATLDGTTIVTITGAFPPTIPVYVWFGDKGIVEAASADGETLVIASPEVLTPGITDVSVRFTLDRAYRLTLSRAFTFGTSPGGATTTTAAGGTTTVRPTTTVAGPTTTARPTTTVAGPTTTVRPTTTVAGSTTVAGPTTTSSGSTTTSTTIPLTPELELRPQPLAGALSTLTTSSWPRPGCTSASCAASPRPAP